MVPAVFASSDFTIDPLKPLAFYPWVRWAPEFSQSPVEQWTAKACNGAPTITRVITYQTLSRLIKKGAGIGCLSPLFAKDNPNLKQISPLIKEASLDVWLLTHPDLRGVKRIDALKELIIDMFNSQEKLSVNPTDLQHI